MNLAHHEASDQLEALALGVLTDREAAAVRAHLRECAECRARAAELDDAVSTIPDGLRAPAPSPALRERILAAAAAESRPLLYLRRAALPAAMRGWAVAALLVFVSAASIAATVNSQRQAAELRAERDEYFRIATSVSQGGRWWYMAGTDAFKGSGGTLIDPRKDGQAFVLFHDLRPVGANARYAVWLIRADGTWARAATFTRSGEPVQRVDVALNVSDFVQCAVTVEMADAGPRAGPLAMQSRIFAP